MTTAPDPVRYPIGRRPDLAPGERVPAFLPAAARRMEAATRDWRALLSGVGDADLARTYRPGAFTVRQLAHHVADAHLHGLVRLRHGLTEDGFVIRPFDPDDWAALPDMALPVDVALNLLDALTAHWAILLDRTDPAAFAREITHPDEGPQDLWQLVAKHDWQLRHHLEHARIALGLR